jgi:hypothetical protein
MHAGRVLAVAVVALVVTASGCGTTRVQRTEVTRIDNARAAHRGAPAPANPDLGTVMERFYQQVEGAHWPFAYAMLSPRYRAALGQDALVARYAAFADLDVSLRQSGDRVVVATVGAKERGAPARARRFEETITLAWDGEDWKIDRIVRRDVSAAGTR